MKHRFPLRLGAPSELYPLAKMETAIKAISKSVDLIEVTLEYPRQLPITEKMIRDLLELKLSLSLDYTIHLPVFIQLGNPNPLIRDASLKTLESVFQKVAPIEPLHYVLHVAPVYVPGKTPLGYVFDGILFEGYALSIIEEALKRVSFLQDPALIGIENLESNMGNLYCNIDFLEPIIKKLGFGITLDVGHLLSSNQDPRIFYLKHKDLIQSIHLHDYVDGRNHRLLGEKEGALDLSSFIGLLIEGGYRSPVILELFHPEEIEKSIAALEKTWRDLQEMNEYTL